MCGIRRHRIAIAAVAQMLTPAAKLGLVVAIFWVVASNHELPRRLIGMPVGAAWLRLAATDGETTQLIAALQAGTPADAPDMGGRTPLHWAAAQNHRQAAQLLLAAGADFNAADSQGFTPLMAAASGGHAELVQLLLAAGADPNDRNGHGSTASTCATIAGHDTIAEMLIDLEDSDFSPTPPAVVRTPSEHDPGRTFVRVF
jgi:hypothetical protein